MRLELGTSVRCSDGEFGELVDLVIDPTSRRLTHLVVTPRHPAGANRLVPTELAEPAGKKEVALRCTVDEASKLECVQEFAYLRGGDVPVEDPGWEVGIENVMAMPYYPTVDLESYPLPYDDRFGISYDRVPKGEVEIRRASEVQSADGGHLGHVDGFVVDADDQITHLVLERGHLWSRRDVTIPIGAVTKVGSDSVTVSLTKDELEELPAVRVHRWLG